MSASSHMGGEGNCRQVPSLSTVAGIDLGLFCTSNILGEFIQHYWQ